MFINSHPSRPLFRSRCLSTWSRSLTHQGEGCYPDKQLIHVSREGNSEMVVTRKPSKTVQCWSWGCLKEKGWGVTLTLKRISRGHCLSLWFAVRTAVFEDLS